MSVEFKYISQIGYFTTINDYNLKISNTICCGEYHCSISKTGSNGIDCTFYESKFYSSIKGCSNWINKRVRELQ